LFYGKSTQLYKSMSTCLEVPPGVSRVEPREVVGERKARAGVSNDMHRLLATIQRDMDMQALPGLLPSDDVKLAIKIYFAK
jgi:hypothetical protein